MQGHFGKHNLPPVKFMREVAMTTPVEAGQKQAAGENPAAETNGQVKIGDKVLVDIFQDDKFVDVTGTSKGRGFAGVVRRHHFGGGPKSHGHMFQVQGSIGASRRVHSRDSACLVTWESINARYATCASWASILRTTC
jgi:large subunit ribosomal protein L3